LLLDPILQFVDVVGKVGRKFRLGFEAEFSVNYSIEPEWPSSIRALELVLDGVNEKWESKFDLLVGHFGEFAASNDGFWLFAE